MEAQRRGVLIRRYPLSDCTNTLARPSSDSSSSTPSVLLKPTKPNPSSSSAFNKPSTTPSSNVSANADLGNASNPSSLPPPSPPLITSSLPGVVDYDVSEPVSVVCGSRHASDGRNCDNASTPSCLTPSNVSTPPGPPKTCSVAGTIDLEVSEPISIVYSRRHTSDNRRNKEKAVANTVNSTPIQKISNSREKSDAVEGAHLPKAKALTVPCRKKQRTVSSEQGAFKDALLQDFIKKQTAYFKEIDEFRLSEEEVESIDELD